MQSRVISPAWGVLGYVTGRHLDTVELGPRPGVAYGSNGTLAANFNGYGVYVYNGGWTQINGVIATELWISSATDTVFGSFPGYGIWEFTLNGWKQINTNTTPILG